MMLDGNARGLSLTEVLELRHLPEEGLKFEESLDPSWLDARLDIETPVGFACESAHARLEIQPMGPVESRPPILVRGAAHARLRSTCVRCLEDVLMSVSVEIEQTLFAEHDEQLAAAAVEALDEGAYSAEGIDLPDVLREALILGLAMNPVCEDEAGCDARTASLIAEANEKVGMPVDPRWASLLALKKQQESS